MQNKITNLLRMTYEQQKQILRSFSKLPIEACIQVFQGHRQIFYTLKNSHKNTDLAILSYISFVLSVNEYITNTTDIDKNSLDVRAKSIRRFGKREKLLSKWALIKELKNDKDLSFRQIVKYLQKYHKLGVAHSTVYDLWKELEENKKGEEQYDR